MTKLLTNQRVVALSRINRYNGWTRRPYSVLEHTVVGALTLVKMNMPVDAVKAFMLHDMEESEFGDHIRPVKHMIRQSNEYNKAVEDFNNTIAEQNGIDPVWFYVSDVKAVDDGMIPAEFETVVVKNYQHSSGMPERHRHHDHMVDLIMTETLRGDRAVAGWWALWESL